MADHINLSRLSQVAPPSSWQRKAPLEQAGFVFKDERVLCGAPRAVGQYWAPGAADVAFHAQLDGRDHVTQRTWTPVTKQEHDRLRQGIEPRTGQTHLLFAWLPLPPQREEISPPPTSSPSDSKIELATDEDITDNDPSIQNAEPVDIHGLEMDKKETKKTNKSKSASKKKSELSTDENETDV